MSNKIRSHQRTDCRPYCNSVLNNSSINPCTNSCCCSGNTTTSESRCSSSNVSMTTSKISSRKSRTSPFLTRDENHSPLESRSLSSFSVTPGPTDSLVVSSSSPNTRIQELRHHHLHHHHHHFNPAAVSFPFPTAPFNHNSGLVWNSSPSTSTQSVGTAMISSSHDSSQRNSYHFLNHSMIHASHPHNYPKEFEAIGIHSQAMTSMTLTGQRPLNCNTHSSAEKDAFSSTTVSSTTNCSTPTAVVKSSRPRRRIASVAQRRAANIRERRRMFNLNSAFDRLRKKVPTFAYEKRLSRIDTLRLAMTYIRFMTDIINETDAGVESKERFDSQLEPSSGLSCLKMQTEKSVNVSNFLGRRHQHQVP